MVLADSHGIPRAPCYSGNHITAAEHITTTGLSPSTVRHPHRFVYMPAPHCDRPADLPNMGPQHRTCNPCRVSHTYGLAPSAFARHYSRNHFCFLFLQVLRCFTSLRSLHTVYVFNRGSRNTLRGVSPFGNPGINVRLSTPPGLSQIPTSFIGSCCQGIHHAPLETSKHSEAPKMSN